MSKIRHAYHRHLIFIKPDKMMLLMTPKFSLWSGILWLCTLLCSCYSTQKLIYVNDAIKEVYSASISDVESPIRKNDLVSISVSSLNPEASYVFNAPNLSAANINTWTAIGNASPTGYLVNQDGMIIFPILGKIMAAGMTKSQLATLLTDQLREKKLLVDPIVNIRLLNFRISVLGEVGRPGVYQVPNEKLSLLEAIALAGDISIYGRKDNVLLIRENEDGTKHLYRINMNSSSSLESPFYYLRSNDVVYVEPGQNRVQRERTQFLFPMIVSLVSLGIIVIDRIGI